MKEMLKDSSQVAYKTRFKEFRWRKLADPRSNHEESVPQALSRKFQQEKTVQKYLSITFSTDRVPLIILSLHLISLIPCKYRQFRNICQLERPGTLATQSHLSDMFSQNTSQRLAMGSSEAVFLKESIILLEKHPYKLFQCHFLFSKAHSIFVLSFSTSYWGFYVCMCSYACLHVSGFFSIAFLFLFLRMSLLLNLILPTGQII